MRSGGSWSNNPPGLPISRLADSAHATQRCILPGWTPHGAAPPGSGAQHTGHGIWTHGIRHTDVDWTGSLVWIDRHNAMPILSRGQTDHGGRDGNAASLGRVHGLVVADSGSQRCRQRNAVDSSDRADASAPRGSGDARYSLAAVLPLDPGAEASSRPPRTCKPVSVRRSAGRVERRFQPARPGGIVSIQEPGDGDSAHASRVRRRAQPRGDADRRSLQPPKRTPRLAARIGFVGLTAWAKMGLGHAQGKQQPV